MRVTIFHCIALQAFCIAVFGTWNAAAVEKKSGDTAVEQAPKRTEWALLPAVGYDSDIGFKFGALTILTRMNPAYRPFRWKCEAQFQMSVKDGPQGAELPIHDHFLKLDIPGLLGDRVRLYFEAGFNKNITAAWYGLGNASSGDDGGNPRRFQYKKQSPYTAFLVRVSLWRDISAFISAGYRYTAFDFWPGESSRLEEDIARSESGVGESIFGYQDHSTLRGRVGVVWDTRDHETNPVRGALVELSLRGSPGSWTSANHDFMGIHLAATKHVPLYKEWLSLAFRLAGDMLFGKVPFGELTAVQGTSRFDAFGGSKGVRGIPAGRYNGKVKLLSSLELRAVFLRFAIRSQQFRLGASLFGDAGRVWYELKAHPELDGTGPGLKFGVGGGPQVLWGESVAIRIDVAYSPDAAPVGIYLEAGRSF